MTVWFDAVCVNLFWRSNVRTSKRPSLKYVLDRTNDDMIWKFPFHLRCPVENSRYPLVARFLSCTLTRVAKRVHDCTIRFIRTRGRRRRGYRSPSQWRFFFWVTGPFRRNRCSTPRATPGMQFAVFLSHPRKTSILIIMKVINHFLFFCIIVNVRYYDL